MKLYHYCAYAPMKNLYVAGVIYNNSDLSKGDNYTNLVEYIAKNCKPPLAVGDIIITSLTVIG